MLRFLIFTFLSLLLSLSAFSQRGVIKGTVKDASNGEPVPFANVVLLEGDSEVDGATTDFNGNYTIKDIHPGEYNLSASFVGYQTQKITGLVVAADKITFYDFKMSSGVKIDAVKVIEYKKPLLDKDNPTNKYATSEEVTRMPTRSVSSVAATTGGVYKQDENSAVNVRGSRDNATDYYVDGMLVRGNLGLAQSSIEQIAILTGGVPAKYGDATGGIISVTTKGPSQKFKGGVEYVTSNIFDTYNYNLLGFSATGPIIKKKKPDGSKGRAVLGFFVAGEGRVTSDTDPSAIGMWKIKDDTLAWLKNNPFRVSPISQSGQLGLLSNAEFLSEDDFENIQSKLNNGESGYRINAKIDFKPTLGVNLTFGASHDFEDDDFHQQGYSLLNWDNMPHYLTTTQRLFGRITQKFGSQDDGKESSSLVKNAFYSINFDYNKYAYDLEHKNHGSNLFNYGYVGRFQTYQDKFFIDSLVNGDPQQAIAVHVANFDTLYTFEPSNINPDLSAYTSAYYDLYESNVGSITNQYLLQGLGLRNGDQPSRVYSLWDNFGDIYGAYRKYDTRQFSVKAEAAADIGDHEISFGFEYQKRKFNYFYCAAPALWNRMRALTNTHILELDTVANYTYVNQITGETMTSQIDPWNIGSEWTFQDTITFDRMFVGDAQSYFDLMLRNKVGAGQLEFIDVDSYDPSIFSLDMFTADELLADASYYVYYYGYDHTGNELNYRPTLQDFFNKQNSLGQYERPVAPFEPIYASGYIQDKFSVDDLIFNIGVRVDRYDANQQVLKDKYLFHDAYTAGEVNEIAGINIDHPDNIGSDYVVYVDDFVNPSFITGYRNEDKWYNTNGVEISDPTIITDQSNGKIAPYLIDDTPDRSERYLAFEDYQPELVFMPRISFSFPISDQAQFFAHYDVLTQRPPDGGRLNPFDYYFIENEVGGRINNPDLKMEKTIDYEVGFAQTLSRKSSLTLSAFYRELRDMIQVTNVLYAYPATYETYGNLDFGTVKGFTVSYDLRRTGNVSFTANYTLQFANGTGSSATSGSSLINTGMPNLRTLLPLSYDQRHALTATVDYRYGSGKDYNGLFLFGKPVFANSGANLIFSAGSGTPFSKQSNITQEAASGINDRSILEGSLYGSRLPWSYRISTRFNKQFEIKWEKENGNMKKIGLNVYVQIQNLLNTQNIISVYRATGNPDDDGYLSAAGSQSEINTKNNPSSFINLYEMAVNNPNNYSMPRMARLGITLDF